jgi:predicted component of type VI protein secretion system
MAIALVPVVGQIWALIETGFLPGTVGPNQYGPDPLQLSRAGEAVQAQQSSLTAVAGPLAGMMLTLAAGDLLVGSDARCDVSLPGAGVLDRHARIRYAQGAWFIQEIVGSGAGIMVNGQPIKACRLNNGDQITIGPNIVVFNA